MTTAAEPTSDPERAVGELRALLLAGQRFRQAVADHFGLSLSAAVVPGHLADAGGQLMPSELTERMLVGSGTLTAIIDRLAHNGHVHRRPDPGDRRRVHSRSHRPDVESFATRSNISNKLQPRHARFPLRHFARARHGTACRGRSPAASSPGGWAIARQHQFSQGVSAASAASVSNASRDFQDLTH